MQYIHSGSGGDGPATLSGTDAPIDSSCSGSSGGTSLAATNVSFADGKVILIHQSRGTGAGNWELNIIDSYSAGTITTAFDLVNTYTDSGASQAQVIQLPEYSSVTVTGTFTAKAWDGNVGGIIAFLSSGDITISGTVTASGKGFRGGSGSSNSAQAGEGTSGAATTQTTANGSGGGGGAKAPDSGHIEGGHGGGGGNGAAGGSGSGKNTATPGAGGSSSGSADGSTFTFGGGGGGGGGTYSGAESGTNGAPGGGLIFMWSGGTITVTGAITSDGSSATGNNNGAGCGAGGAGGGIYLESVQGIYGTNKITALAGSGGTSTGAFNGSGATGAVGRIVLRSCSLTGTTNPSANESIGDHDYCVIPASIY